MKDENLSEKRTLFLDMHDHPERYTDDEMARLLADSDIHEFASLMGTARRALRHDLTEQPDVDEAWRQFAAMHPVGRRRWPRVAAVTTGIVFLSGVALAAVLRWGFTGHRPQGSRHAATAQTQPATSADSTAILTARQADSSDTLTVTFDNAELGTILHQMGAFYHADVVFASEQTRHTRLYFRWDKRLPLEQQADLLNTFDRINISLKDHTLTVD